MYKDRVSVKIESKAGSEEAYFKEQEQKQIKKLENTTKEMQQTPSNILEFTPSNSF